MKYLVTPEGHWLWMGGRTGGHPAFKVNGKVVMARRYYWAQKHGKEPRARLDVKCGDRNCVNPEHCREHKNKPVRKVRLSHAERRRQHQEIIMLRGCEKREVIAHMYGMAPDTISHIWSPSNW